MVASQAELLNSTSVTIEIPSIAPEHAHLWRGTDDLRISNRRFKIPHEFVRNDIGVHAFKHGPASVDRGRSSPLRNAIFTFGKSSFDVLAGFDNGMRDG